MHRIKKPATNRKLVPAFGYHKADMTTEQKYSITFNITAITGRLFSNLISIVPPAKRGPIGLKMPIRAVFHLLIVYPVFAALDLFIRATFQTIYKKSS